MKDEISDGLREFYRRWLEAKAFGDATRLKEAYQLYPGDEDTDVNEYPTCDILKNAFMYKHEAHLLEEHRRLLEREFGTYYKPFGDWDDCVSNRLRVEFIKKYAE